MDEAERRRALADFLRTRRKRLRPEDVGLPERNRRRTPGLRREEVAELAGIGTSWYTSLEQGQAINPSMQVLARLAEALRLSTVEQHHLFLLARQDLFTGGKENEEQVTPAMQTVVDALVPHPAFLIGRRWDVLAWNQAAELLFRFHEPYPPHSRNVVWRFFRDGVRKIDQDWEVQAQNLIAQFRADSARYPGDPFFHELIVDLGRKSSQFARWWEQHEVRGLPDGPRIMQHPDLGLLEFDHLTFQTSFMPDIRLKIYVAALTTATKLSDAMQQMKE